jgi:hypothetical protein
MSNQDDDDYEDLFWENYRNFNHRDQGYPQSLLVFNDRKNNVRAYQDHFHENKHKLFDDWSRRNANIPIKDFGVALKPYEVPANLSRDEKEAGK